MPGAEKSTEKILQPFATEMRHLTSALNVIASDMIREDRRARVAGSLAAHAGQAVSMSAV